ncbi:unnamed protein product [Durusdinium trenchii]|uniref:C3H1-type domain-containing protein n=1 Tax=Durusdinium trenchii TaxID=1381693 RepID=A0ABP0K2G5_9DINO
METLSYQNTFLDMNISQEDSHRSLSVPPRAKTTMMRHEDLEKHRADYATSLLARAAETFSWPVTQTETLGSHGHPEICGNPCIRFFYGNCQKGVDCQFCHLKHAQVGPFLGPRTWRTWR